MHNERRKPMNGDDEEQISEMRQKDISLGINKWLEDPGSIERADKFIDRLLMKQYAKIGKAVVYSVLTLAMVGSVIVYLWSNMKE